MKRVILISVILLVLSIVAISFIDVLPSSKTDFKIRGIDISHHNKINNWKKIKKQNTFCIMKATEGSSFKDPMFSNYWRKCDDNNIIRGAYHFFKPGVSAEKQFNNYKRHVKLTKNDLPPILDVELKECDINEVNKWMKLAEKYYGVKPILYSDYLFFKILIENKLDNYPLWLHINKKYNVKPSFNNYDCVLWQYDQFGTIDGISGYVDLDTFIGDENEFKNLLID